MAVAANEVPARYDRIADFYEGFAPDTYDDQPINALIALSGNVQGLRVLDLACGHGRLTRELARRGANVVGVDISTALLTKARERERSDVQGIDYIHANVAASDALAGRHFDGVTSNFALSDIDDLEGVAATVARVLMPGGFFAFSILHPCFPGWEPRNAASSWSPGRGYFTEGWWIGPGPAGGLRPMVGANHRTMSTYLNTLIRHGLVLQQMAEPEPPQDWLDQAPSGGPVPVYLVVRCRKS